MRQIKPYPIIILRGQAGSGKDTFAGFLKKLGAVTIAQAAPLKDFCSDVLKMDHKSLWGPSEARNEVIYRRTDLLENYVKQQYAAGKWIKEVGLGSLDHGGWLDRWFRKYVTDGEGEKTSARQVLQNLGTEYGRRLKDTVWTDYALKNADKLLVQGAPLVVITDGRFRNELLAVKKIGGLIVEVKPVQASQNKSSHQSETELEGIPAFWNDAIIYNDKGPGGLARLERDAIELLGITHV